MIARTIIEALKDHYTRQDDCLFFPELRVGTGYGKDAEQRIDAWCMYSIPSKQFRRVAFEVKVSRSDFLNEIKQPRKRAYAMMLSNEFYFATPPGLVRADELPPECGLVEVHESQADALQSLFGDTGNMYGRAANRPGDRLHFKHAALHRDTPPPSWRFLAALTRRALRDGENKHANRDIKAGLTPIEEAVA